MLGCDSEANGVGIEAFRTGQLNVRRPDREELLAIRDGMWTYDQLEDIADASTTELGAAAATSALPDDPDLAFLDELCEGIVERELGC